MTVPDNWRFFNPPEYVECLKNHLMSGTNEKYPGLISCQAMNSSSLATAPPGSTFPPGSQSSQSAELALIQECCLLGGNYGHFLKIRDKNATEHQRALQLLYCNHRIVHINFIIFITPEITKLSEKHLKYNLRKGEIAITLSWQTCGLFRVIFLLTKGEFFSTTYISAALHDPDGSLSI